MPHLIFCSLALNSHCPINCRGEAAGCRVGEQETVKFSWCYQQNLAVVVISAPGWMRGNFLAREGTLAAQRVFMSVSDHEQCGDGLQFCRGQNTFLKLCCVLHLNRVITMVIAFLRMHKTWISHDQVCMKGMLKQKRFKIYRKKGQILILVG